MQKLLKLLLGCAILCENSAHFIKDIQTLDVYLQEKLVTHIKEVNFKETRGDYLSLHGKENGISITLEACIA